MSPSGLTARELMSPKLAGPMSPWLGPLTKPSKPLPASTEIVTPPKPARASAPAGKASQVEGGCDAGLQPAVTLSASTAWNHRFEIFMGTAIDSRNEST